AIEGVVNQKTNYKYRLLIGEDCSTDGSRAIIEKYAFLYPEKVFPLYHKKNVGAAENSKALFRQCKGKYIALCDGDDYWIDPLKLQKQIDFLEANPDYAICFHRVYELEEGKTPVISSIGNPEVETTFTLRDLAQRNFLQTPSVVYRRELTSE